MDFDAIIVRAGAGGMSVAARLSHAGYRTLVVEALPRIGGRASTRDVDGFLLNTGALVIERGGMVEQTIRDIGKTLDLHVPKQQTVLVWGKRTISMDTGLPAFLRDQAPPFLRFMGKAFPGLKPKPGQSTRDWLNHLTRNKAIHGLLDNVVGAMFAATLDIFPADVFLYYFTEGSAFKKIGLPPGGTIAVRSGTSRTCCTGAASTSGTRRFGSGGSGSDRCLPPRSAGDWSSGCRPAVGDGVSTRSL